MSAKELRALAERCEAATGPALVLDEAIAKLIHELDGRMWSGLSRPYSASLDAAMTLVPEDGNHFPRVSKWFNGQWEGVCYEQFSGERNQAIAATPALALCAAALRAREESSK